MPLDPALEEKLNSLMGQWEAEEPGSTDVDAGPNAPAETVLPEMDLSSAPPPAPEPLRLRAPQASPATVGAGVGAKPPAVGGPEPKPTASSVPDWDTLASKLKFAEMGRGDSQAYENMFANVAPGYKPNAHAGEAGVNIAKQGIEMPHTAQAFERGQIANESAKGGMKVKAAMDDANSLQSQKAREAFKTYLGGSVGLPSGFDSWSANDLHQFTSTGDMSKILAARNAAADDARKVAGAKDKADAEATALENSRKAFAPQLKKMGIDPTRASQKDIDRAIQESDSQSRLALAARGAERADNPKLPPSQVAEVADYKTASKAADQLYDDFIAADVSGFGSKIKGKISEATDTDLGAVSRYNDKADTAAQSIGLALEGGKLGEADLPRYKHQMPRPGDSPQRASEKRDNLKRALADKAAGRSTEWFKAGYKVPGSDGSPETPAIPGSGHGAVVRETNGFRRYADGFVEEK